MEQNRLNVRKVTLRYRGAAEPVLRQASLQAAPGEIVGLVGASGSGKSTLLKAVLNPKLYQIEVLEGEIVSPYQGRTGVIFQNAQESFHPLFWFRHQFKEVMKSHGIWKGRESEEKILAMFERLGLPEGKQILSSYPWEMSGGMNQRISIAMAAMLRPQLLLADEPTSALDASSQLQVMQELLRLRELEHMTVLLVTHNLELAQTVCDRLFQVKKEGVICPF